MWEKISESSILFNKDFYNNNNFYKNNIFIKKLYYYYTNKGYYNIIISQIINILLSNFIIIFIIFLFNVIDYKKILNISDYTYLSEILKWDRFFNLNYFMWTMLVIFLFYTIIKILNLIDSIIKYYYIKKYYNENLDICDKKLDYTNWGTIINKISENQGEYIDINLINNIISHKENYLIILFDHNIIKYTHLTNLMEWNIVYCILLKVFSHYNNNIKNDKDIFYNKKNIIRNIQYTTKIISIINFIFMPFILTIMLFFNIFNYGEQFYNNPHLLTSRIFTKNARWKFRYYNELNHEFENRLNKIEKISLEYTKSFTNNFFILISKLILFVCSSLFITLIILSLLNDKLLIYVLITKNQSILWIIGILGSIIAILKSDNRKIDPCSLINQICENIYIEKNFLEIYDIFQQNTKFCVLYEYKIINIIMDIFYTIMAPFQLWELSYNIEYIINFIFKNTMEHEELNYICKLSYFKEIELNNISNIKSILSMKYFKKNHPKWDIYKKEKLFNITREVKINII